MKITQPKQPATLALNASASGVSVSDPGGAFGGDPVTLQQVLDLIAAGGLTQYLTVIRGGQGTTQDLGTLGATATVDLANANYFFGTLAEDCTLSTTGWTPDKDSQITVEITEDGTGGWTPTFDGVTWIGGTPTWDTTLDTVTIAILFSRDGGTTIYGAVVGSGGASVSFATPAIVLGTAAAAGAAATVIRSDSTIVAFDATVPEAVGAAADTGSADVAARRDHVHDIAGVIPGTGGGGLVLLEQHTASSSASLDFTAFISSTYDDYVIEGVHLIPATDGVSLLCQVGTGGGPTYDTGANYYIPSAVTGFRFGSTVSNAAGYGQVSFSVRFTDPQSTTQMKQMFGVSNWHDGTNATAAGAAGGLWAVTTAVTAIRFLFSSGNIASGTIRVYGIAK